MIDLDEKRLKSLQISLLQIRNQQVQNRKYIRQILTKHQMKNNRDKASLINYLVESTQKTEDKLNNILHWIQGELDVLDMIEMESGKKELTEEVSVAEEVKNISRTINALKCVFDSEYSEWCTTHKTFKHADTTTQRDLDFEDRRLGL